MGLYSEVYDFVVAMVDPWLFLLLGCTHIPAAISQILTTDPTRIFSLSHFSGVLFGHFWSQIGPHIKMSGERRVIPLLEGRVQNGLITSETVNEPVSGTVLEVGAGSGMWMDVFSRLNTNTGDKAITKIYGVEPNPMSAAALTQKVRDLNMEKVYEVVPVGIEDVDDPKKWNGQIPLESVDCIVSVLCLCSIPEPEKNIKQLYKLLKPGGRWYVYEHIRCSRGGAALSLYQKLLNLFWPFFLGGCQICRPTGQTLRDAGPWTAWSVAQPNDEPWYKLVPHILGVLVK